MNDLQWRSVGSVGSGDLAGPGSAEGHAQALATQLGYTPIYLHYNSGLHISDNGRQFAALLEQLWQAWPQPVQESALLTHSMGGLVARSACHHGELAGHHWRGGLKKLVFLGAPHHGAPLETLGSWVDTLLGSNVVTRSFARIGQIRSAGITNLRHGNLLDADWKNAGRFDAAVDARQPVPLPTGVVCFAVAATAVSDGEGALAPVRQTLNRKIWGDGLVPLDSALGRHEDARHRLMFAPENQWIADGMGHMTLLDSPEVTKQLVYWLKGPGQS